MIPINFFAPTSLRTRGGTTLGEDQIIDLPMVPFSLFEFADGDGHDPDEQEQVVGSSKLAQDELNSNKMAKWGDIIAGYKSYGYEFNP